MRVGNTVKRMKVQNACLPQILGWPINLVPYWA
jgi:hypothetical protein